MKTSELFEKEISLIKNECIKNIVRDTLNASPECIQTIPASSSGKYHPSASLGEGGLVRHIKSTVGIARALIETNVFRDIVFNNDYDELYNDTEMLDIFKDCAYAALILHDCCKPDDTPKHYTRFDHPLLAAALFKEECKKYITKDNMNYMKTIIPIIYKAIAAHMGQFSTASYAEGIRLPEPYTGFETFVHMCDLLSSKRYIDFNFEKYE